jgi:RHS repeat-associated protein
MSHLRWFHGLRRKSPLLRRRALELERLEDRTLLSTVTWGLAGSGYWDVAANWQGGKAPGSGDNVVISTALAATITIKSGDNVSITSLSTDADDTLAITGGTLTLASTSPLSGPLAMTGGTLTASGAAAVVTASGMTTVSGASLFATGGGSLSLPGLTSYTSSTITTLQADGAGSVLDLSFLTAITQSDYAHINATRGGEVKLSALTSLSSPGNYLQIVDTGGSTLLDTNVTSLSKVTITTDGTDLHVADSWTQFTGGQLTVTGGSYSLAGLTDVDNSSLIVQSGGSLSLPGMASYTSSTITTLQADGTGSVLDLSFLTAITQSDYTHINATKGGDVKLGALTSLSSPGNSLQIVDSGGSTLLDSSLTSLNKVTITTDGTDQHVADSWIQFTGGQLTVTGGSYSLSGLTDVDNSSLFAQSGGSLSLPGLASYTSSTITTLQADGTGSVLDLSFLTAITQSDYTHINATKGGDVKLGALTSLSSPGNSLQIVDSGGSTLLDSSLTSLNKVTITTDGTDLHVADSWIQFTGGQLTVTGSSYSLSGLTDIDNSSLFAQSGGSLSLPGLASYTSSTLTTLQADGTGSVLDLSFLTAITQSNYTHINATKGGKVNLNALTSLSSAGNNLQIIDSGTSMLVTGSLTSLGGVTLNTDNTDAQLASSWTTFTNGSLTVTAGTLVLPSMTTFAGSSMHLSAGTGLNFPVLTHGSVALTNGTSVTVQGTLVALPATGSSGGTINVPPSQGLLFTLTNSGTLTNTTINVGQGTFLGLPGGTYAGGSLFNVGQNATVTLAGGTYTGGATFRVGAGATIDLTGGQTTRFGGTFTGIGAGTVLLGSGNFFPVLGGATLNFPGSMFQWTGGAMELSVGDVTSLGTINLSGANQTQIYADGTLNNFGTIIQTGTGNFGLHSDNVTPTTLMIEPGAQYLMESDAGINNLFYTNRIVNQGTIRKVAGTGTSTITVSGVLDNTGTIEVDSGTLALAPTSIAQVSGSTLAGGTWSTLNGAALRLPSGASIVTNNARVSLGGPGANIAGLGGLSVNNGSFTVSGGAGFTTTGDFTSSGNLTVGAGSVLNVTGNFTQTSGGTLSAQIGGIPAGGLFGQVAVTGTATLAGTLNAAMVNAYIPTAGQVYNLLTFASVTGNFTAFTGLSPYFTESLTATAQQLIAATGPVDLVTSNVSASTSATAGQSITVTWQASDQSSQALSTSWQDSVYLSPTPNITSQSILIAGVPHVGGLAANGQYSGSWTGAVPSLAPGYYYVLVQADSLYQTADGDRANNIAAAGTGQIQVMVPSLTVGTPLTDAFTAADQDHYYQVSVPAGSSLQIALASTAGSGGVALYVSQGTLPTPYNYQAAAANANVPSPSLSMPQVSAATTYYILAHSIAGAAATAGFTLTINQSNGLGVSAFWPGAGGDHGTVTVEIDGTNFSPSTTATLTLGATTIDATTIYFANANQVFATFPLEGQALGSYTLKVQDGTQLVTAPTLFAVVGATQVFPPRQAGTTSNSVLANASSQLQPLPLNVRVNTPQYVRSGRTGTVTVTYTNQNNFDLVAPLLSVTSANPAVYFSTPDDPNNFVQEAQVLAVAANGPAGILRPGQTGTLTLTLLSDDTHNGALLPVDVSETITGDDSGGAAPIINWAAQQATLQPPGFNAAAWNVIFANLQTALGSTTDSYNAALAQAATYLGSLGDSPAVVGVVSRLWSFLVSQADAAFPGATLASAVDAALPTPGSLSLAMNRTFGSTIASRYQPSIFGMGWTTSWQMALSTDTAGNATIASGTGATYFFRQPNGGFLDTAGECGTLTNSGSVYTFTDPAGAQDVFFAPGSGAPGSPGGKLSYMQDNNGNRITLGYNAQNQLVTLTYTNAADSAEPSEQLALTYNGQGLVSALADGTGATWAYVYDVAGHLLSVVGPGGLTRSYTYDTGNNPETANALLSITNTDGSVQNFSYDPATGRLTGASANGGADLVSYTYPAEAEVIATDASNAASTVWYNDLDMPARIQNPLGAVSNYSYDTNGNVTTYTDAAGNAYRYSYDASGNLTAIVNPLGHTTGMTFGTSSNLTSTTDAAGNTTQYTYGPTGNLLTITYPDNTQKSFTYDPLGNLSETVLQNGDPVSYQTNAQGLVTLQTFADGTSQAFSYDAHSNLLTAQSFDATGTLAGTTTLTYNAANRLTSITYPNAQFLHFTYNAQGQRTQSVDQDGFKVNYAYDALGRLSTLTDGSNNSIVHYTYNSVGQLSRKDNGNGTYTTYAYDAARNLTSIVDYANSAGTAINSSFTYTYNTLNEQTSMTDNVGNTTSYGYDPTGQLIQVMLPGGQTIQYVYNATGDRTEVVNNGTATLYASNADNEITQVGSATYTYDANGNLHTVSDVGGTTTYTYNDLNQLVSITHPGGSVQGFQYSALGFMVGMSTTSGSAGQTNCLVDPSGLSNVVAAYNGGSLIANYTYGLGLVSQSGPSGTGYYDFDSTANTVGVTGTAGTYINQYSYLPFGETATIAATLPNPFTFAGQAGVMQIANGLFNMRARNYAPVLGQFLSNDPLRLQGGSANFRIYVLNSPTHLTDPSGLQPGSAHAGTPADPIPISPAQWAAEDAKMQADLDSWYSGAGFALSGIGLDYLYAGVYDSRWGGGSTHPESEKSYYIEGGPLAGQTMTGAELNYYWQGVIAARYGMSQDAMDLIIRLWKAQYGLMGKPSTPSANTFQAAHSGYSHTQASADPNALIGPTGFGPQAFIAPTGDASYTIEFENDGSAAAQVVTVTEQMDANLDWSTFQLGSFGFGPTTVAVPGGTTQYKSTVNYQNTDGSSLNVNVTLDFNVQTGLLTATFSSLDPLTGAAPAGVFDGLLPPDDSSHVGEGFVQYSIQPKAGRATGATISQQASIVFDINAALATNAAANTIDAAPPTSTVNPLPADSLSSFLVSWSGQDDASGSGVASYDVYVSTNGGPWHLWQDKTAQTSAVYNGQLGNTYSFYAIAHDNVGNIEANPAAAEAVTQTALYQATLSEPAGTTTPATEKISTLLGSHYGDPDGSKRTRPGIAVVGTNGTGAWQYFNGSGWLNIGAVAQTSALLLPQADALRFLPGGVGAGSAQLLFVAWDGSQGSAGRYANASVVGGGTPFSIGAGMFNVTLTAVTQAPVWLAGTATLTPVLPGTTSPVGQTVQQAFGRVFTGDNGQAAGIAVTGATSTTSGTWKYNLYQSGTQTYAGWKPFPAASAAAALLLSGQDMVAFVPKSGFIGAVTLTVRAWDQSAGIDGGTVNLNKTGTGGKTAFSANPLTATIHVNTAPVQKPPAGGITLTPAIHENTIGTPVSVATLLKAAQATDGDKGTALGLALTAVSGPGVWQYNLGGGWLAVPATLSDTQALLLPPSALLHFVPTPNQAGTATLTWLAWDQTQGRGGAPGVDTTARGGACAFSTTSATATLVMIAGHTRPAWSAGAPMLTPVAPGDSNPPGDTVQALFGSFYQNAPSTTVGIAISGVGGTTSGTWQYSHDGQHWTNLPAVAPGKPLKVIATDYVRFVPRAGFLGAVTLTAYAWDGTTLSTTTLIATCLVNTSPILTP